MNRSESNVAKGFVDQETTTPTDFLEYIKSKRSQEVTGPLRLGGATFLTADSKMKQICEVITQVANANVSVLIMGESGTGKEVIARMIHEASNRKDKPFVAINCAAVPPSLLESELFGHEKGSFTGAVARHIGKFEQASGGTLLLDEVTEIDPQLQAKLLRALQERQIERIGGSGPIDIDTRIIATSNRDVAATVKSGQFRQDLYYRLHVINIEIPPLRDRKKDVELLANHFLRKFGADFHKPNCRLAPDALDKLLNYSWPGNIRELQNIIQRTILIAGSDLIRAVDIPISLEKRAQSFDWIRHLPIGSRMRDVETHFIIETLKHHNGNRTHAAKTLGISLRTLRNKINEFTAGGYDVPAPTTGKPL
jgi:transcriptional regulator with PAS, ATPase and Fis domain